MEGESQLDQALSADDLEFLEGKGLLRRPDCAGLGPLLNGESGGARLWARLFLGLGVLFALAGILFFFAANWKGMSPGLRLMSVQIGLLSLALPAAVLGSRSLVGSWLLFGAVFLVGVLMAVFGQVYQTGADAFENFALWAALTLPWVLVSRFLPTWMLWLVVTQTALVLFGGQVLVPNGVAPWEAVFACLGLLSFFALAGWEWLRERGGFEWMRFAWFRTVLVAAGLAWLTTIPFRRVFDFDFRGNLDLAWAFPGTVIWFLSVAGCFVYFSRFRRDLVSVAFALSSAGFILVIAIGRLFEDALDSPLVWLFLALVSLGTFGGITATLLRLHRQCPSLRHEPV